MKSVTVDPGPLPTEVRDALTTLVMWGIDAAVKHVVELRR